MLTCQKLGQGRWLAQGVRVPAAKPDDASTIPGSTGRREMVPTGCLLAST